MNLTIKDFEVTLPTQYPTDVWVEVRKNSETNAARVFKFPKYLTIDGRRRTITNCSVGLFDFPKLKKMLEVYYLELFEKLL